MSGLFSGGVRMLHEEAVELTLQSLRAYWDRHQHVAVAWSGGKDSTATITLIVHLIEAGHLPRPAKLYVFYADTRQELPPIQRAAELLMAMLAQRDWIEVTVVRAPLDKRFMVYILGRGVPPQPLANKHYRPDSEFYVHCWSKGYHPQGTLAEKARTVDAYSVRGKAKFGHPTVKPDAVMDKIVRNVAGSTICDPFMGTGSTGVAAVKAGKAFVGIEQNPTHFETACQRIAAALEGTAQ